MKKLTTLLLAAALAAPSASIALPDLNYSTSDIDYITDEDLSWSFAVVDGEAIITGVSPTSNDWYPYNGFVSVPEQVTGWESGQTYTVVGVESITGLPQYLTSEQMENFYFYLPATIRFIYDWAFQDFYSPQVHIVNNGPQLEYIGENAFLQDPFVRLTDYWPNTDWGATNVFWFLGGVVRNIGAWNPTANTSFFDLSSYRGVAAGSLRDLQYLQNVILPSTIKILPHHLFTGCSALREIVIPATVTNIEACVFANCSSLTNITFEGNAPMVAPPFDQWDDGHPVGVFTGVNSNCVVIVQRGTTGWGNVPGIWQGMPIRYADGELPPAPTVIDLSTLTGDYTATNGVILTNSTTYVVTIPAGATVTINGVTVMGGGGAGNSPATFAEGDEAFTSAFAPGANGTWRLTTYAELAGGSAAGLADAQIKVRRADTVAGLATAEPTTNGVTVIEKKDAVKVDLEVAVPPNTESQFFRIEFGE